MNNERKLASLQRIIEVRPIPDADKICAYKVQEWFVVDSVGKYNVGDLVVFCEVDSFIPTELASFLSKGKEPKEYLGIKGERLRTIRLKKQVSQGLLLSIEHCIGVVGCWSTLEEGTDVTEWLGIIKWEPPEEFLAANVKGNFPSFIPKTAQERVQNMRSDIEQYQRENMKFEKTEKIHGTSVTFYVNGELFGVCSRNLDLKDEDNTYWNTEKKYNVISLIKSTGRNLAVQGEIYGSGINGNLYQLDDQRLAVFDIYDIDNQTYLLPEQRWKLVSDLGLPHVPLKGFGDLVGTVSDLLEDADGMSVVNPKCIREGYVYKSMVDTNISFKVIGNSYLLHKG